MKLHCRVAAAVLLVSVAAVPLADASRLGPSITAISALTRGSSAAYDSKNSVYLVVSANGTVNGRFVTADGQPVGAQFVIYSNIFSHFPRVAYSPDANGGAGGFLVTWHESTPAGGANPFVRTVAFSGGAAVMGPVTQLATDGSWWESGPNVAYSTGSREFLVTWQAAGIRAHRVSNTGAALGSQIFVTGTSYHRDPSVAYNPQNNEFLVVYCGHDGTAFAAARRVAAGSGALLGAPTELNRSSGTYISDVAYNAATNTYLATWYDLAGGTVGRVLTASGAVASNLILLSSRFAGNDSLGVAYNPTSGTHMVVAHDRQSGQDGAIEVGSDGVPLNAGFVATDMPATRGNFYPRVAARTDAAQWLLTTATDFSSTTVQRLQSSATGAPPPPAPAPPAPPAPPPAPAPPPVAPPPPAPPAVPDMQALPFNYNGDVLRDVLLYNRTTGAWSIQLGNLQGQFTTGPSGTWIPGARVFVADFDGNGLDDLFVYSEFTGAWSKVINSGTDFTYFSQVWQPNFTVFIVDLNADRRSDVFLYNFGTGLWYTAISTGDGRGGFDYRTGGWIPGFRVLPADFDADGRTDFLLYHPTGGGFFKAITRGNGVFAYSGGSWAPGWMPTIAELNGDGRADVFLYSPSGGFWYRAVSTGDGTGEFHYTAGQWAPGWTVTAADFDGNILTDLFLYNPASGVWYKVFNWNTDFTYTSGVWAEWRTSIARLNGDIVDDVLLYNPATSIWYQAFTAPGPEGFTYTVGMFPR